MPPQQSVGAVTGSGSSVLTSLEQPLLQKALGLPDTMYGFGGVLSGAASFFAFIGFDIIATAAEEAKEPKRTVPLWHYHRFGHCYLPSM